MPCQPLLNRSGRAFVMIFELSQDDILLMRTAGPGIGGLAPAGVPVTVTIFIAFTEAIASETEALNPFIFFILAL